MSQFQDNTLILSDREMLALVSAIGSTSTNQRERCAIHYRINSNYAHDISLENPTYNRLFHCWISSEPSPRILAPVDITDRMAHFFFLALACCVFENVRLVSSFIVRTNPTTLERYTPLSLVEARSLICDLFDVFKNLIGVTDNGNVFQQTTQNNS